jgi:hypothetical protein
MACFSCECLAGQIEYGGAARKVNGLRLSLEAASPLLHTFMRVPSFRPWLETRLPEVSDTMSVALTIIQGGKEGASAAELQQAAGCSSDALRDLLAALMAGGRVETVQVRGQMVHRMAQ